MTIIFNAYHRQYECFCNDKHRQNYQCFRNDKYLFSEVNSPFFTRNLHKITNANYTIKIY